MQSRSLILLILMLLASTPVALAQPIVDGGLLAHWPLDSPSDMVAGIEGYLVGDPELVPGVHGLALDLNGSDEYIRIDDLGVHTLDLSGPFTVSVWVNPRVLDRNQKLYSKDNILEFEIAHAGAGRYSARINNIRRGRGSTSLVAGVWQHVVVSWDGTTVRYYLDGYPDGEAAFAGPLRSNDRNVGLGARPASYLDGMIDEVSIYGRALDDSEIEALFESGLIGEGDLAPPVRSSGSPGDILPLTTSTVELSVTTDEPAECRYSDRPQTEFEDMVSVLTAVDNDHIAILSGLPTEIPLRYWIRCQDLSGNTNTDDYAISFSIGAAADLVGHWTFNEGTAENSSKYPLQTEVVDHAHLGPGLLGSALRLDGQGDLLAISSDDPSPTPLDIQHELTLSAWIRLPTGFGDRHLITKDNAYELDVGQAIENRYSLKLANQLVGLGETPIQLGIWQHVAATWNGEVATFFYNGNYDGSSPFQGPIPVSSDPLGIGARPINNHSYSGYTWGEMDDVRIYNRALAATEIRSMVDATLPEAPRLVLIEPDGIDDTDTVEITWVDTDPDHDAQISLFYAPERDPANRALIAAELSEDDEADSYFWDASALPAGGYWVQAVIDDGVNPPVETWSRGSVDVGFSVVVEEIPLLADVLSGATVVFQARTEPPGFEEHIDWYIGTSDHKTGRVEFPRGTGATHSTTIELDDFVEDDSGLAYRDYDVYAGDQAVAGAWEDLERIFNYYNSQGLSFGSGVLKNGEGGGSGGGGSGGGGGGLLNWIKRIVWSFFCPELSGELEIIKGRKVTYPDGTVVIDGVSVSGSVSVSP